MRRAIALALALAGCSSGEPTGTPDGPPAPPVLRRLSAAQYKSAIADLFGAEILVTRAIEPDLPAHGLDALGAAETSISPWGVEQYESIAFDVAEQAMTSTSVRAALGADAHEGIVDLEATKRFAARLARRAWRRPATPDEIAALARTGTTAAEVLGGYARGLELVIAAVLESPSFLYRAELGDGAGKLDPYELASRLSFFLWGSIPDDELLDAAERGELSREDGLRAQAARLLASPRARAGLRAFFTDVLRLRALDELVKDPMIFPHYSIDLGPAAREETLHALEALVFDEDGDFRDIYVRERAWVDRRLASIYKVRAPSLEGFGEVTLAREGGRRGLLGQVSTLALHSHPVSSSATLRGRFVRDVLLCDEVPPPPVGVNTALPEPSGNTRTLKERVAEHLGSAACSGCHRYMDPIGLGLESFDGVGRFRATDHGAPIDPASELDGVPFADAWELGQALHDHPYVPGCVMRHLYRYSTGALEPPKTATTDALSELTARFEAHGYRLKPMLLDFVASPAFSALSEATP